MILLLGKTNSQLKKKKVPPLSSAIHEILMYLVIPMEIAKTIYINSPAYQIAACSDKSDIEPLVSVNFG